MNTSQLERILQTDVMTSDMYRGVYAMDTLPELQHGSYIINTDDADEPGEHWLAVFNDNGDVEYFDSFGRAPWYERLKLFLGTEYKYNATPLQLLFSNACGFYCVYYILNRCRGYSMEEIMNILKRSDGDYVVKDYLYRLYKPVFYLG